MLDGDESKVDMLCTVQSVWERWNGSRDGGKEKWYIFFIEE